MVDTTARFRAPRENPSKEKANPSQLAGIPRVQKSEYCGGGSHKVPGPFVIRKKKLNQHS